ncbi:DNA polymerase II subunit B4-like [Andrographis paniculata]|uniref:DNA polymerase II subunit B4-like n=1 Tax=Andrographis paniculata TaxID=175694 RepID=UPI0021E79A39|nr:DNA polymerase II subunit B4-like [Andrographis paniculata]XP_051134067.1 DNA polymerase II subunit B4-like [Andrographis paniculata]
MAEKGKEVTETVEMMPPEPEGLPKAIVRRVVKDKLSEISTDSDNISLLGESLQAFSEGARVFIHYLSASANEICKESNRQTINTEDVFKALEEIQFGEFIGPLRASLEELRGKKSGASKEKKTNKKSKRKESTAESDDQEKRHKAADVEDDENS